MRYKAVLLSSTLLLITGLALSLWGHFPALVIWNNTPSLPKGAYLYRPDLPIEKGAIVAIPTPIRIIRFWKHHYGHNGPRRLLKPVIGLHGDFACRQGRALVVNGELLASTLLTDSNNNKLPQWRGCRALSQDEVLLYSNRVSRSLDSRYFGPVHKESIVGVYTLLWGRGEH